jgi:hypothetical protein
MYRINLDVINKIICIEVSGSMTLDEIHSSINDFSDLVSKFQQRQYSMLILAQRLDPISQDNLPVFQCLIELALTWAERIAVVNGNRTITKMQLKRIESDIRNKLKSDTPLKRFHIIAEAMNYLDRV